MANDETIVTALLSTNTIRAAAKSAGVSESTVFGKLRDRSFCKLLEEQRHYIFIEAVNNIISKIDEAIEAIASVMNDKEAPPQIRLAAAESMLKNVGVLESRMNASRNKVIPSEFDEYVKTTITKS